MSAEPLTREERALLGSAPDLIDPHRLAEALVAAEERAERYRGALQAIRAYSTGSHYYHMNIGCDCGVDACGVCLIEHTAAEVLTADRAEVER